MSEKCAHCGKTVYFSEKQSYDGKAFHGLCMQAFKKTQKPTLVGYYGPADADRVAGQLKTNPKPAAAAPASSGGGGGGAKFCSSCGTARGAGNFCANCGAKL